MLSELEMRNKVRFLINQHQLGLETESNKVEFKSKWFNLKDKIGISSFMKSISAIANTYGLEGFLIFGYDESTKKLHETNFTMCGLDDKSKILDIMTRNLSDIIPINIIDDKLNGISYSFVHIPPTNKKPIIIKNYQTKDKKGNIKDNQHRVFVRTASGTRYAQKFDFDLMNYDNSNIKTEFDLEIDYLNWHIESNPTSIKILMEVENIGLRPLIIGSSSIVFEDDSESVQFNASYIKVNEEDLKGTPIRLVLKPGDITRLYIKYQTYFIKSEKEISKLFRDKKYQKEVLIRTNKSLIFRKNIE